MGIIEPRSHDAVSVPHNVRLNVEKMSPPLGTTNFHIICLEPESPKAKKKLQVTSTSVELARRNACVQGALWKSLNISYLLRGLLTRISDDTTTPRSRHTKPTSDSILALDLCCEDPSPTSFLPRSIYLALGELSFPYNNNLF